MGRNQLATWPPDVDVPADPACAQAGLLYRADLRVGRGKDGDHLAQLVRIVADGMTGPRFDDHRVTESSAPVCSRLAIGWAGDAWLHGGRPAITGISVFRPDERALRIGRLPARGTGHLR